MNQAAEEHLIRETHQKNEQGEASGGLAGITSHRSMQAPMSVRSHETGMAQDGTVFCLKH